jgi:hypothetical protein
MELITCLLFLRKIFEDFKKKKYLLNVEENERNSLLSISKRIYIRLLLIHSKIRFIEAEDRKQLDLLLENLRNVRFFLFSLINQFVLMKFYISKFKEYLCN